MLLWKPHIWSVWLYNKIFSEKYRIQSDSFSALYIIIRQFINKSKRYFDKVGGPKFSITFPGPLPLQEYFDVIDTHFDVSLKTETNSGHWGAGTPNLYLIAHFGSGPCCTQAFKKIWYYQYYHWLWTCFLDRRSFFDPQKLFWSITQKLYDRSS